MIWRIYAIWSLDVFFVGFEGQCVIRRIYAIWNLGVFWTINVMWRIHMILRSGVIWRIYVTWKTGLIWKNGMIWKIGVITGSSVYKLYPTFVAVSPQLRNLDTSWSRNIFLLTSAAFSTNLKKGTRAIELSISSWELMLFLHRTTQMQYLLFPQNVLPWIAQCWETVAWWFPESSPYNK